MISSFDPHLSGFGVLFSYRSFIKRDLTTSSRSLISVLWIWLYLRGELLLSVFKNFWRWGVEDGNNRGEKVRGTRRDGLQRSEACSPSAPSSPS